jgi:hypothetical protein
MEEEMKKRFGVLKALASILKILGIIVAAVSVLGGLVAFVMSFAGTDLFEAMGFDSTSGMMVGLMGSFVGIIVGLLYAVLLYGYGEMIMLFISIEDNTFRTVTLLEDVTKEEK